MLVGGSTYVKVTLVVSFDHNDAFSELQLSDGNNSKLSLFSVEIQAPFVTSFVINAECYNLIISIHRRLSLLDSLERSGKTVLVVKGDGENTTVVSSSIAVFGSAFHVPLN